MVEFDKHGTCYKCGGSVSRAKKTETWHHNNIDDYHKCGFVKVKRDVSKINEKFLYFCVGCRQVHYDNGFDSNQGDLLIADTNKFMDSVKEHGDVLVGKDEQ